MRLFRDEAREEVLERDGVVRVPLLTDDERAAVWGLYRAEHGDAFPPQPRDGVHMTIWCADRAYKERVRDGLRRVLGPAVARVFHAVRLVSPVFVVKAPGGGNLFPLHQDWSVVDETRHRAVNLWIPLHDVDPGSGTLWVVPGSHRLGSPRRGAGHLFPRLAGLEPALAAHRVSPPCRGGDARVCYHRLLHGSPANASAAPRVVAALSLVPEDVPLQICFQRGPEDPLLLFEPGDDFIYAYDNVRDDTPRVPPAGDPVAVLPPSPAVTLSADDVRRALGRA